MTSEIEYKCNNCGHEGINTRAEPDVAGLVRYRLDGVDRMIYSEKGDYVLHSEAAAVIERYKKDSGAAIAAMVRNNERAEAAEAELAQIKAQKPVAYRFRYSEQKRWHYDETDRSCWERQLLFAAPVDQTAEIERLKATMQYIIDCNATNPQDFKQIALAALEGIDNVRKT